MPVWLKEKLYTRRQFERALGSRLKKNLLYIKHHESHAASAYFPSPFDDAAILTIDGVGEWDTTTIGVGEGNHIKLLKTIDFPHSLGLLYSAFTYFTGFKVNSGEYKLMGLAPYGAPKYVDAILNNLVDLKEDGSFALNMNYFNYCQGLTMTNQRFGELFCGPARKPESLITQREMDLAASIQVVTEKIVLKIAKYVREITRKKNLCMAGGVALNCVANGKLLKAGIFDNVWIQPAAGDAGGALGACMTVHYQLLDNERKVQQGQDQMKGSYLGPQYSNKEIQTFLDKDNIKYKYIEDEAMLLNMVAKEMAVGKVIGWFQNRMEFGPRALGARSIIGDARNEKMQSIMNLKIKYRESFRPFAPVVLEEDATNYFELEKVSPYMLLVANVKPDLLCEISDEEKLLMKQVDLSKRINIKRSLIPAITHVDNSARVQTVNEERNKRFYRLIKAFKKETGSSVIINTSFNIRGEPIVCTPLEAYRCFMSTQMDILVLENCILKKEEQMKLDTKTQKNYLNDFSLD